MKIQVTVSKLDAGQIKEENVSNSWKVYIEGPCSRGVNFYSSRREAVFAALSQLLNEYDLVLHEEGDGG
ncbi:MAG: hypothetical protein KAQ85_01670 [Thermodesulfovibrionia bacterium]|nr:hypothetical protein [Thermodesulfovibrionia bacterium]